MKRLVYIAASLAVFAAVAAFGGYSVWSGLDPEKSCASCHEIKPMHQSWKTSAHSKIACTQCHGTAFSDGIQGMCEKAGMVVSHLAGNVSNVRLSESQRLAIMKRCASCHKNESAKWSQGAHSTTYANIFCDKTHNNAEKPYWDCFRCHGMFYEGNINTLMDLEGAPSSWRIKDEKQRARPAIPCMACHQIHTPAPQIPDFKNCRESAAPKLSASKSALYSRADAAHIRSDLLIDVKRYLDGKSVKVSGEASAKLCANCHSPNWRREAGTSDDRTPVGAHEGFSCVVCHDPHSNSAAASCAKCHDCSAEKYKFKSGKCPQFIIKK